MGYQNISCMIIDPLLVITYVENICKDMDILSIEYSLKFLEKQMNFLFWQIQLLLTTVMH